MKEQHQKPIYNKIVAAIPHSVSKARYFNWNDNIALTAQIKEWTDWFTDELFVTDTPGVTAIIGNISRFECDLERLEIESLPSIRHCLAEPEGAAQAQFEVNIMVK